MRKLILIFLFLLLSGCAGTNFVRQQDDSFKLGQSSYQQVIDKMGPPRMIDEILRNGVTIQKVMYSYAITTGEAYMPDIIPAKAQIYLFENKTLIGEGYVSSFKSDATYFDESKISLIIKGKTTKQEVINLLGRPTFKAIPPFTKEGNDAIGYEYTAARGGFGLIALVKGSFRVHTKSLVISLNQNNIVEDVEYNKTGEDK